MIFILTFSVPQHFHVVIVAAAEHLERLQPTDELREVLLVGAAGEARQWQHASLKVSQHNYNLVERAVQVKYSALVIRLLLNAHWVVLVLASQVPMVQCAAEESQRQLAVLVEFVLVVQQQR